MRRTAFRSLAATSIALAALFVAGIVRSARRPRYGGTLRTEIGAAVASLNPAAPFANTAESAAKEKLMALAFDRLVTFDERGQLMPGLAISWQTGPDHKKWTFRLRENVRFHNGSVFSLDDIDSILKTANPGWRIATEVESVGGFQEEIVEIETDSPAPGLPAELASPRNFIFRRNADGSLVGTGPFKIDSWEAGRRAVFAAFEGNWQGRPFVDSIEVQMGRGARDRLIDLEVGKTDFVEIPPEEARRAMDRGVRVSASQPDELLALVFTAGRPVAEDARTRHALASSIDRAAIVNFILQKQGEAAGGLLPQWSTGTAFLFSTVPDSAQAKQLASQINPAPALLLGYDGADALEKAVAERIVVNARDAGLAVRAQPVTAQAKASSQFDARLIRLRMDSPLPRPALAGFLAALAPMTGLDLAPLLDEATPQDIYERERAAVDSCRVIPLVHLADAYGLSPRVKDWVAPPAGGGQGWPFANVWLEGEGR
ncbi:MAG: ABC transporter substrate-binding protein [Candidatus Acidiferrales bacterium]